MQGFQSSAPNTSSGLFGNALHQANSLFTPKRVGYTLAGAFVVVGATVALTGGAASQSSNSTAQHFNVQTSTDSTKPGASDTTGNQAPSDSSASTSTSLSANSSGDGTPNVQLNVNGQNVPVPANGSTQQTITNGNGSTTTVDVHGNTTTQGSSSNSSSSSFSLNVNSSSSSSGGSN